MERRLSILQRRDKEKPDEDESEHPIPSTPQPTRLSLRKEEIASNSSEVQEESHTSSAEGTRAPLAPAASQQTESTPRQQSKRSAKRRLKTDPDDTHDGKRAKRKTQKLTHVRTSSDYSGLQLQVPQVPANDVAVAVCVDKEKEEESIAGQDFDVWCA